MPLVPVGQPVRPLVTRVTGATPPTVAEESDALAAGDTTPAGGYL